MQPIVITLVFLAASLDLSAAVQAFPVSPLRHIRDAQPSPGSLNIELGIGLSDNCYLMRERDIDPTPRGQTAPVQECD